MFESISWQSFFEVLAKLTGAYYAIAILLLFSCEITTFFRQKKPDGKQNQNAQPQNDLTESNSLMGQVRFENRSTQHREENVNSDEVVMAPNQEVEEEITVISTQSHQADPTREITELQQQIKALVEVAASNTKEECVPLFQALLSNYPQIIGTPFQELITAYLFTNCKKKCDFPLELTEVNSWWPPNPQYPIPNNQ